MEVIKYEVIEDKIISIRNEKVIIDSDIAELYGVETKRINEAVKNNPDKFPDGYIIEFKKNEWDEVKSKFSTSPLGGGKVKLPNGFTEKGLYMLATILKSHKSTATTLAIIDTFAKLRELNRAIARIQDLPENSTKQKTLLARTGELMADIVMPDDDELSIHESETTLEIGFPFLRIKKTVKKKPKE